MTRPFGGGNRMHRKSDGLTRGDTYIVHIGAEVLLAQTFLGWWRGLLVFQNEQGHRRYILPKHGRWAVAYMRPEVVDTYRREVGLQQPLGPLAATEEESYAGPQGAARGH